MQLLIEFLLINQQFTVHIVIRVLLVVPVFCARAARAGRITRNPLPSLLWLFGVGLTQCRVLPLSNAGAAGLPLRAR